MGVGPGAADVARPDHGDNQIVDVQGKCGSTGLVYHHAHRAGGALSSVWAAPDYARVSGLIRRRHGAGRCPMGEGPAATDLPRAHRRQAQHMGVQGEGSYHTFIRRHGHRDRTYGTGGVAAPTGEGRAHIRHRSQVHTRAEVVDLAAVPRAVDACGIAGDGAASGAVHGNGERVHFGLDFLCVATGVREPERTVINGHAHAAVLQAPRRIGRGGPGGVLECGVVKAPVAGGPSGAVRRPVVKLRVAQGVDGSYSEVRLQQRTHGVWPARRAGGDAKHMRDDKRLVESWVPVDIPPPSKSLL